MNHGLSALKRRAWSRRVPAPVALLIAMLLTGLAVPAPANAAGNIAGFELDGDIAATSSIDWQNAGVTPFNDRVDGFDTTTFTSSSKESDVSSWSLGSNGAPPAKVDIGYHAAHIARDGGNGHWWMFVGWDRFGDKGEGSMILELNQGGTGAKSRAKGDLRVVVDVSTNGGMQFNNASLWDGSGWTGSVPAGSVQFEHATSTIDALGPWASSPSAFAGKIGADRFGEAAVDLTALKLAMEKDRCHVSGPGSWQLRSTTGRNNPSIAPSGNEGPDNLSDGTDVHAINMPATCGSLIWQKRVETEAGPLLGGATFELSPADATATPVDPRTIVDNGPNDFDPRDGYFQADDIVPGDYMLAETSAPAGYEGAAKPRRVTITAGQQTDASIFINRLGSIEFTKATKGDLTALVAGAEFTLTALSGPAAEAPWNLDEKPIVVKDNSDGDDDGNGGAFLISDLPMGWYSVKETGRPTGYDVDPALGYAHVMSSGVAEVYSNQMPGETDKPYVFQNAARLTTIEITKYDSTAQKALNGAIFFICKDDPASDGFEPAVDCAKPNQVDTLTSGDDGDGAAMSAGLPFGEYWVWEDAAPKGYTLDDPRYQSVNITPENDGAMVSLTFSNAQKLVDTRLRKVDADTGDGLAGATFELYRQTEGEPVLIGTCTSMADDEATTEVDESGYCDPEFKELAFGTYRIKETVTPAGYKTPTSDFEFTLGPNEGEAGSVEVTVDNAAIVKTPVPAIAKSAVPASGSTVTAGDTITYTLTLTNTGDGDAVGDVVDTLPAGVTVLDVGGGTVSGGGGTITWSDVTVAPGETVTLTYTVVVDAAAPAGTIANSVTWTVGTTVLTASTTHTIAAGGGGGGGGGGLPFTGGNDAAHAGLTAVMLGAGLLMARTGRRRVRG